MWSRRLFLTNSVFEIFYGRQCSKKFNRVFLDTVWLTLPIYEEKNEKKFAQISHCRHLTIGGNSYKLVKYQGSLWWGHPLLILNYYDSIFRPNLRIFSNLFESWVCRTQTFESASNESEPIRIQTHSDPNIQIWYIPSWTLTGLGFVGRGGGFNIKSIFGCSCGVRRSGWECELSCVVNWLLIPKLWFIFDFFRIM